MYHLGMMKKTGTLYAALVSRLKDTGMKVRAVGVDRLPELKEEIEGRSRPMMDQRLYWKEISGFKYTLPEEIPDARSILVTAAAQPALAVIFEWNDREYTVMVPPIYHHESDRQAAGIIKELLEPGGFRVTKAVLPEKLLAVRSGLAEYGRNNIIYVEGMGSFHRPAVFFTDAPFEEEHWGEQKVADLCATCGACIKKCPTGAISKKRFLLNAEKCLTYFNESTRKFPRWLKPEWHHCLIGCMRCQEDCPLNRPYFKQADGGTFTHEETEQILAGIDGDKLSPGVVEKLGNIDLLDDYKQVSRNLNALMAQY